MDSIVIHAFRSPDDFVVKSKLPEGFIAPITEKNGQCVCEMPKYGIDVEEPADKFQQAFLDELRFLWDAYATEPDCNLDSEAQAVKRALNEVFEQTSFKAWQTPRVVETTGEKQTEAL